MKNVHLILNGKGGIGKSVVSSFFTQFLISKNLPVLGIDCDASNNTFSQYEKLNIKRVAVANDNNMTIDSKKFDNVMNEIINSTEEHIIIDSGASSFLNLVNYIIETDIINILNQNDCVTYIHLILAGGDMLQESFISAKAVINKLDTNYIIWLNEHFGSFIGNDHFLKSKHFQEIQNKIGKVIIIPKQSSDLTEKDVQKMLKLKITFDEVKDSKEFSLFEKSRINFYKNILFTEIDKFLVA